MFNKLVKIEQKLMKKDSTLLMERYETPTLEVVEYKIERGLGLSFNVSPSNPGLLNPDQDLGTEDYEDGGTLYF